MITCCLTYVQPRNWFSNSEKTIFEKKTEIIKANDFTAAQSLAEKFLAGRRLISLKAIIGAPPPERPTPH
jgi:hypothetical protein